MIGIGDKGADVVGAVVIVGDVAGFGAFTSAVNGASMTMTALWPLNLKP